MQAPTVKAVMVIRKPASEVYEAFVDPSVTTHFWFTDSTGRLEPDAHVTWRWSMYDASADVTVKELEQDERIVVEWTGPGNLIEWTFEPQSDGSTFVTLTNSGFSGGDDELMANALDTQSGFTYLLAGAKFYLEHGIDPNLVVDHMPH